ncbi:protein transport protein Sec31A isoform X2 [Scyliorhinus canicula]|uniref:protein transport protein Sec31A isoform X2 n=1 Tax=Scyliorhinus canicula TaxID=7830 RepID=UPI0018F6E193|nr:protein transport protein Sec31A isoform X2 [Scyliorhinus canicula]
MKLKEIERTAIQSWSPASHHPLFLATGTSAQQLDATFSTSAALEIYELDFSDASLDAKLRGCLPATNRFHKLIWSNHGTSSNGVIAAGGDTGTITLYSADQILVSGNDPIIGQSEKHAGPVRGLDFNPFQSNLMASGANDSEIYIWDLNNFSTPMTPGAKSQPSEDISCVGWNRQVQHILASAHPSGRAVVWDLRKNEPIIKVSDHSNRMRCSGMAWNPEVATQLVLASEDDRMPVLQIWDLRFATSPLKVLENHTRGILSISWCQADAELLLSSAKDNRILCWNPNTGEVVYELPTSSQWCFDVQWCPRNPAVLSAASFDGRISVYSVMGGSLEAQKQNHVDKISSSFNNLDPFGTGQTLPLLDISQKTGHPTVVLPLKKPPKWIRRPVGASFAFGGKLITFCNSKAAPPQIQQPASRQVFVSVVTTETEFLCRSSELQTALQSEAFVQYCQSKINTAPTDFEKNIWNFLKVNFEQDPRTKYLNLLGYSKEGLDKKIASSLGNGVRLRNLEVEATERVQKMPGVSSQSSSSEESIAAGDASATSDFFDNIPGQRPVFEIPVTGDTEGLISQALLIGNFEGAVELCLKDDHFADAIILAIAGGEELLAQTQNRYFAKRKTKISRLVSAVVTHNWRDIVESCDLDNWKEALAALLTYAKPEVFPLLCDTLGSRLEMENEGQLCMQACLCYICSGNVEKLVECWVKTHESSTPLALEDLVEKIMILQKAIELLQGTDMAAEGPVFAKKLTQYASLLAAQGSLEAAMSYLPTSSDQFTVLQLRDRLFHAQGEATVGQQPPTFPFNQVVMRSIRPTSTPAPTPARQTPPQRPVQPIAQQMPYQTSFSPQAPLCPSAPTVFTPQPVPVAPATVLPAQGIAGMYSKQGAPRPAYPQHPTTVSAPAFSQFQNFGQQKVPPSGLPAYPLQNPLPGSGLTGPSLPTASLSGPTMPGVSMSGPSLMTPASMSYQPSNPLPPTHGTQPGTLPTYPGHHQHQPHPPTSLPGIHSTFPHPTGTGGPGAPSSKPFTSAAVPPPPPTGFLPWLQNRSCASGFQDGWNDPPAVRAGQRKKMLPDNYTPPAPITAPVVNFSTDGQQLRPQVFVPQEIGQGPPGAPKEANLQPLQQLPTEKIVKKQIPEEHMVLKTTFDGLVQRCLLAAGDPQTKRKLDDATKRLDYLYDKLREQTLSPHILSGLHEIVRNIEECNYQQALAVHTHVVSSSNFSEISAFMPVLKVVVTIANKLNI